MYFIPLIASGLLLLHLCQSQSSQLISNDFTTTFDLATGRIQSISNENIGISTYLTDDFDIIINETSSNTIYNFSSTDGNVWTVSSVYISPNNTYAKTKYISNKYTDYSITVHYQFIVIIHQFVIHLK